jgi:hypothetical protein
VIGHMALVANAAASGGPIVGCTCGQSRAQPRSGSPYSYIFAGAATPPCQGCGSPRLTVGIGVAAIIRISVFRRPFLSLWLHNDG